MKVHHTEVITLRISEWLSGILRSPPSAVPEFCGFPPYPGNLLLPESPRLSDAAPTEGSPAVPQVPPAPLTVPPVSAPDDSEFLLTAALPQKSVLYIPESCHPSVFPLLMPPLSGHAAVPASDRFPPGSCPEGRFALFPPASVLLRWLLSVLFSPAAALLPPAFSVPVHPAVFWQSPLAPLRKDKPALFWQAYTDYNGCIHCV